MRYVLIVTAAMALAGCQFIPGTPQYAIKEGEKAVAMTFPDPASTQFIDGAQIHTTLNNASNVSICGRVNTKNLMGAYVGFKRYVHNKGRTLVDPMAVTKFGELTEALTACNSDTADWFRAGNYGPVHTEACEALPEVRARIALQGVFEKIYFNNCNDHTMSKLENEVSGQVRWSLDHPL